MKDVARNRPSNYGSFIVDAQGTILGFDQAMEALTQWPAGEIVGHNKELSVGSSTASLPLYEGRIPTISTGGNIGLRLNCRDGNRLQVETSARRLDGTGDRMLITVLDVVARSARRDVPTHAARTDALTGLPDGEAFAATLASDFRSAALTSRPLALILVDIDHLRDVNDVHGHAAGDTVLRKLAGILRVSVEDEMRVARIDGDNFAILLPGGGRSDARQLAALLRSTVERFRFFEIRDADQPHVTVSLGSASFPADADSEEELLERAHEALEEARSMGRNRVWCYLRRPRVPLQVPVFFDGADPMLVGYTRDLSPSGIFVQTGASIDVGMRCALAFPLPGHAGKVHVVGRVVRTVAPETSDEVQELRVQGLGVEFERFGGSHDRRAIEAFLHKREDQTVRPETGVLSS